VAAVASYLDARAHSGEWLLRIEDIDEPRCSAAATDSILRTLERFELHWDGRPVWQSLRKELYKDALERLRRNGQAYGCACSRRDVGDAAYPGTCRNGTPEGRAVRAWRFRVPAGTASFIDRWQGKFAQDVETEVGDFVLLRADGYFAYQLAVVVDDAEQGITDIVRGADLLDSTPRQLLLQRALNYPEPRYLHVPVVVGADGEKLSKQTLAPAVDDLDPDVALRQALAFLGLNAPPDADPLAWAVAAWRTKTA
jgi:glutamyl-Q tRNA(Asp) synthetase